jgi:hypothetical protein
MRSGCGAGFQACTCGVRGIRNGCRLGSLHHKETVDALRRTFYSAAMGGAQFSTGHFGFDGTRV